MAHIEDSVAAAVWQCLRTVCRVALEIASRLIYPIYPEDLKIKEALL